MKRDDTAAGGKGRPAGFAGFKGFKGKKAKKEKKEIKGRADGKIMGIAYMVTAVFIAMAVYFGWFIQFESENVIGSPYNARLDRFSDRIVRGRIVSSDGQTLAETIVAADGTETRGCPFGSLFVHAVGYCGLNGRTGLEAQANYYLLSSHVNLLEKVFRELKGVKSPGDQAVATLDADLQRAAADALGSHAGAVIAIGACALTAGLPGLASDGVGRYAAAVYGAAVPSACATLRDPAPVSAYVPVDYEVPCCPVDPAAFVAVLHRALYGSNGFVPTSTLCGECKRNERGCFFEEGELCLGLVTRGGCAARCPHLGRPCNGCAGLSADANLAAARAACDAAGIEGTRLEEALELFNKQGRAGGRSEVVEGQGR